MGLVARRFSAGTDPLFFSLALFPGGLDKLLELGIIAEGIEILVRGRLPDIVLVQGNGCLEMLQGLRLAAEQ